MTTHKPAPESDLLRKVTVRLILPEERARFDQLLEQRHYLQSARLGGQSLRYVAEVDGEWIKASDLDAVLNASIEAPKESA